MGETEDDLVSAFLFERDRRSERRRPLSGASVICIKVMQPAANDNHWPWKGSWENPGPSSCVWREKRREGQEPKKRQRREAMHWLSLAMRVHYSARDPCVHKNVCSASVFRRAVLGPALCLIVPPLQAPNEGDEGRWKGTLKTQTSRAGQVLNGGWWQSNCSN